jgi:hypothetical protein
MEIKADPSRPSRLFLMNCGSAHNDAAAPRETIEAALKNDGRTYRISVIEGPNKIDEIAPRQNRYRRRNGLDECTVGIQSIS